MQKTSYLGRLLLAGVLVLNAGIAAAGISPPPPPSTPGDDNDDTDLLVMIMVAGLVGSSVNCASDAPSIPALCALGGKEAAE